MEPVQAIGGHTNTPAPKGTWIGCGLCHLLRAVERSAPGGQLTRGEVRSDPHFAVAVRALPGGTLGSAGRTNVGLLRRCSEKLSGKRQQCGPAGVR